MEYPIGINPIQTGVRQYVQAQVFPNPVPNNGTAQITYSLPPQLSFGVVELYDLQGQKVRYQVLPAGGSSLTPSPQTQSPLNPLKGTFTQILDLSGLPSGMYVWRLAFPGGYERHESTGKILVSEK
ncbi:MAG: T9SS type A sorting domain-containing protein [Sphingobacteriales bacterium]|nr:MAG: T9SS type A sorting domain-containing protein [Sphingobacteriales bacterium]